MKTTVSLALAMLSAIPLFSQDVEIESFATGLTNPVGIENAGDDRLFIVERRGYIDCGLDVLGASKTMCKKSIGNRFLILGQIKQSREFIASTVWKRNFLCCGCKSGLECI